MEILVTGGAGFIGSHVVDAYIKEEHRVTVVDDLSSGNPKYINTKAEFANMDISNYAHLENLFQINQFDLVNHHAAQVDVRSSVINPQRDAVVNIVGVLNLLQCCVKYNVPQFIFVSSGGAIYGEADNLPLSESYPKTPHSPYGISKLAAEYYLLSHRLNFGLQYVTLRYANVYGPRQPPRSEAAVISTFGRQMLKNISPTIFGSGEQTRDYIFVSDVVAANLLVTRRLAELNRIAPGNVDHLAFNIGTGSEISVNAVFQYLQRHTGFEQTAHYAAPRSGELLRNAVSYAKAEKYLGFRPGVGLDDGLASTLAWIRQNL